MIKIAGPAVKVGPAIFICFVVPWFYAFFRMFRCFDLLDFWYILFFQL